MLFCQHERNIESDCFVEKKDWHWNIRTGNVEPLGQTVLFNVKVKLYNESSYHRPCERRYGRENFIDITHRLTFLYTRFDYNVKTYHNDVIGRILDIIKFIIHE